MVSNARAITAVIVTAVTTTTIHTILEMRRLNNLKPSIKEIVEQEFSTVFDMGWEAALEDRYTVKAAYDRFTLSN